MKPRFTFFVCLFMSTVFQPPANAAELQKLARQGIEEGVVVIGMFGHGVQYGSDAYFGPYDTTVRLVKDSQGRTDGISFLRNTNVPLYAPGGRFESVYGKPARIIR